MHNILSGIAHSKLADKKKINLNSFSLILPTGLTFLKKILILAKILV